MKTISGSGFDTVKSIGLMGGMFDPVHKAHLSTALSALKDFALDEVHMIPCGSPVHRLSSLASDKDRIAMLKLAVQGEPGLIVDERECKSAEPSYTVTTLLSLQEDYPKAKFFLLLGADAFSTLAAWHQWQRLFQLANIVVVTRPGWEFDGSGNLNNFIKERQVSSFEEMNKYVNGKVLFYSFKPMQVGSTQVRELVSENKSAEHLLPEAVWTYIQKNNLYS